MFEWTRTAIDDLQAEIDAIDQRRGEIERVLETLRSFAGDGKETPAPRRRAADKPRTNGSGRTPAKTARPDTGSDDERILQQLRAARGPMKPSDLAKATKLSMFTLRMRLKPMAKQKLIVLTGKTMSRRVGLPGTSATRASDKEEP